MHSGRRDSPARLTHRAEHMRNRAAGTLSRLLYCTVWHCPTLSDSCDEIHLRIQRYAE